MESENLGRRHIVLDDRPLLCQGEIRIIKRLIGSHDDFATRRRYDHAFLRNGFTCLVKNLDTTTDTNILRHCSLQMYETLGLVESLQLTAHVMTCHVIQLVTRKSFLALDIMVQINLETTRGCQNIQLIVAESGGAEHLLLQLDLLSLKAREALEAGARFNPQQFSTLPHVAFIKTKDVVSNEHIRIPLAHVGSPV